MNELALTESPSLRAQYADGYVYVLEISSGRIKVGFTTNLKTRLATHASTAKAYGATITRTWSSPLHREARPNEKVLIDFCRSHEGAAREGEYFAGISYEDVVSFVEGKLTITVVTADATAREQRKAQEREERSRILDRFEERTEFARRRVHAAIRDAGVPAATIVTRHCEMAGCDRYDATALSACGIYYVCPACRESIACLTAIYQEQDAEAARLAEKAEVGV